MSRHVLVLPDDLVHAIAERLEVAGCGLNSSDLQFLRLPHPRTRLPALFIPHETKDGLKSMVFEVQTVAPPNPRSWFMPEGEVLEDGQMLLLTPIDPAFLLITLLECSCPSGDSPNNFRSAEDLLEAATSTFIKGMGTDEDSNTPSCSTDDLLRLLSYQCLERAMKQICEVKEITADITVYRYSKEMVMNYLKAKVKRLSTQSVCEMSTTMIRHLAKNGLMDDGKEDLLDSGRTKAACELLSQYLSGDVYAQLLKQYDFAELDTHFLVIQAEQTAIEELNARAAPKPKKGKGKSQTKGEPVEKKRKAPVKASHGVEKLKKANIDGMSKISSFFQKPA